MELKTAERRLARRFGDGLRTRRKALGYTQDDLASLIGANRRFISELERGKGTSYLGPALAAAEVLGVDISPLFDNLAEPSEPPRLPEV